MNNNNLYVDVHVIQTVPPSCINRDDTGTPKQCTYGGVHRARVSSQSWKRAVRLAFREMYSLEDLSLRTKNIVEMVARQISEKNRNVDATALAIKVLKGAGLKIDEKKPADGTKAMFFMSVAQAKALADIAVNSLVENTVDSPECKKALQENPSIDMALFGRMVAGDLSLKYDAAAMVAHAISTHKVQNEFDYFTAVDDLSADDSSGAGHLDTAEYNSSTLYRYASVNVRELAGNIGKETPLALKNFIEAFILSMPTGKITSFANRSLPNFVYVTVRKDQPVNMAAAFEKPVAMGETGGYIDGSKKAFISYAKSAYSDFVNEPDMSWVVGADTDNLGKSMRLKDMLEDINSYLSSVLREEI